MYVSCFHVLPYCIQTSVIKHTAYSNEMVNIYGQP